LDKGLQNRFVGASAESLVASILLSNCNLVFIPLLDTGIDLVCQLQCGHWITIQVKKSYLDSRRLGSQQFHTGNYGGVDYYAIVTDEQLVYFIRTSLIEAKYNAGLTDELMASSTINKPKCIQEGCNDD